MLAWLYMACILVILPLLVLDRYIRMVTAKWTWFLAATVLFVLSAAVRKVTANIVLRMKESIPRAEKHGAFLQRIPQMIKGYGGNTSPAERFLWLYLGSVVLTFALASDKAAAFWGADGWYMGALTQVLLCLMAFCLAKCRLSAKKVFAIGLLGSVVPCVTAILQRLGMNPFGLYGGMPEEVLRDFLTTVGNRTWFSGYLCVICPLGIWLFIISKRRAEQVLLGLYLFLCFGSMILCYSDSVYPALAVCLFAVWVLSLDSAYHSRFWLLCGLFAAAGIGMELLREVCGRSAFLWVRQARGIAGYFLEMPYMLPLLAVCLLLGLFSLTSVGINVQKKLRKWKLFLCLLPILLCFAYVFVLILNTCGTIAIRIDTPLGKLNEMLVFDAAWGDNRGLIWQTAVRVYTQLGMKEKLFGLGNDCFALGAYNNCYVAAALKAVWGEVTVTNAHNEFLNMLLCGGIVGAVSYIGLFVTAVYISLRGEFPMRVKQSDRGDKDDDPAAKAIGLALLSYMVHNFFCYQQIVAAAPVFLLIGIAIGRCRIQTEEK